jgi:hypothetical protein
MKTSDQDSFDNEPIRSPNEPLLETVVDTPGNVTTLSEDLMAEAADEMPDIGRRVLRVRMADDTHTNIFDLTDLGGEDQSKIERYENLDVDKMIDFVGSEGKYQYSVIAQASLMAVVMSMILYASSYLLSEPSFECPLTGSEIIDKSKCVMDYFCKNFPTENAGLPYPEGWPTKDHQDPNHLGFFVDWKYHGWTQDYHLVCDRLQEKNTYIL